MLLNVNKCTYILLLTYDILSRKSNKLSRDIRDLKLYKILVIIRESSYHSEEAKEIVKNKKKVKLMFSFLYSLKNKITTIYIFFFLFYIIIYRWLTLLLSQEFSLPDVERIWDSLFADPQRFTFLIYICCAMIL